MNALQILIKYKVLIISLFTFILITFIVFKFAPVTVVNPEPINNMYINNVHAEALKVSTTSGKKRIGFSNPTTVYKEETVFLWPFQTYTPKYSGEKQNTASILKESGYTDIAEYPFISEKYFSQNRWLVVYEKSSGGFDTTRVVGVLKYSSKSGLWEVVDRSSSLHEDWWDSIMPDEILNYIENGGR
ncbi:MAG: hypothetical protein U0491_00965 [Candidatus Saccharimonadales bacterium]